MTRVYIAGASEIWRDIPLARPRASFATAKPSAHESYTITSTRFLPFKCSAADLERARVYAQRDGRYTYRLACLRAMYPQTRWLDDRPENFDAMLKELQGAK